MESIKVDTQELRNAASKVDNIAASYEQAYVNMINNVATFTSTDWTGDDATAFKNKVEDFRDDLDRMKKLMNEYASTLRTFAKNYEDTQEQVKQKNQSLRS